MGLRGPLELQTIPGLVYSSAFPLDFPLGVTFARDLGVFPWTTFGGVITRRVSCNNS